MGKRNKKRINYKKLREKRRSKRDIVEGKRLEKLDKANHRRKLKVSIELSLKKLARVINLEPKYLGQ
jgi:hypothetical protein